MDELRLKMTHTFAEIMRDTQNFLYAKSIKE